MGLAKRIARKSQKSFDKKVDRIFRNNDKADSSYRVAYIEQYRRDREIVMTAHNDLIVIFLVAAHRIFGFGKERLERLCRKMLSQIECLDKRYVTVQELEQVIDKEADFRLLNLPEKGNHYRQLLQGVNDRMSAAFMMALLDGWNYKGKRMKRVHDESRRIGHSLAKGEITMTDLWAELDKTKFKGVS